MATVHHELRIVVSGDKERFFDSMIHYLQIATQKAAGVATELTARLMQWTEAGLIDAKMGGLVIDNIEARRGTAQGRTGQTMSLIMR